MSANDRLVRCPDHSQVSFAWFPTEDRRSGLTSRVRATDNSTGRFELFLDLLYVAIVANFAEDLASHVTGAQLVKYIVSLT